MPANIFSTDQVASVREPMWHNLGIIAEEYMPTEWWQQNITPWEAISRRCYTEDGSLLQTQAIVRSDNGAILGEVGPDYRVFTNEETWRFFTDVLQTGDLHIETAGTLFGGKRIWVMARSADFEITGERDVIRQYIYLANSHDGSLKITGGTVDHRIVCSNTLNTALGLASFAVKHTLNSASRVANGAGLMGLAVKQAEKTKELYTALADIRPTSEEVDAVLEQLWPEPENAKRDTWSRPRSMAKDLLENSETCNLPGMEGTAWAAYNAIGEYCDWYHRENQTDDKRWLSAMEGTSHDTKEEALQLLYALA